MGTRYAVVDTETTGNNPLHDRIIQIGIVIVEDEGIIERYSTFIDPGFKLPSFIGKFTGITDAMLENAPSFTEVAPEVQRLLKDANFVAHNVPFDESFLLSEFERVGKAIHIGQKIDTVELARILLPDAVSYQLQHLAERFSFNHENPHRADDDADATAHLFIYLLQQMKLLSSETIDSLMKVEPFLKSDLMNIMERQVQNRETAFNKNDRLALADTKKGTSLMPDPKRLPSFEEDKPEILGRMEVNLSAFESRSGQFKMMDMINDALEQGHHLLLEAGTGIGKSLGYLLPAVYYANQKKKPVIISTNTTQLQQQLLHDDVPIAKSVLPFPFKAVTLKGKQHYLCLRKFTSFFYAKNENYDIALTKAKILVWLTKTEQGDIDELNLPSGGKLIQQQLCGCTEDCYREQSECFLRKKEAELNNAHIVITNHALLLNEAFRKQRMLPDYTNLIIDEAHHIEEAARSALSHEIDYYSFHSVIMRVGTMSDSGLLSKVMQVISNEHVKESKKLAKKLNNMFAEFRFEVDEWFRMIKQFVLEVNQGERTEVGRLRYQYDEDENHFLWPYIKEIGERVKFQLLDIIACMNSLASFISEQTEVFSAFSEQVEALQLQLKQIDALILKKDGEHVSWIEIEEKGALNASSLYSEPIEVKQQLHSFFKQKKTVVFTSAALTTDNQSFSFIKERLGISTKTLKSAIIPSPFSYKENVRIAIPTDTPLINEVSTSDFSKRIAHQICKIAAATNGRMLVLFTSYEMLHSTYLEVKRVMDGEEFYLVAQGISSGSRDKLIKKFKQFDSTILFGTNSFWEGIDIPGEDLSCIVITRLPFSPINDPVFKAREKALRLEGKNVFKELSLPSAIIRFKQGFGRLVRSAEDRGVIVVLDRRLVTASYGRNFFSAIPDVELIEDELENLLVKIPKWL